MKLYNVFVYNYVGSFTDIYMVRADDPWTPGAWQFSG